MAIMRRRLAGLAAAAAIGLPRRARAAEFAFKLGSDVPETHPMTVRGREAAARILEQSSGRLELRLFPNSQLGGDTEMISQARSGALELFAAPSLTLTSLVAASGLPSVGFAFDSYDKVWAAMDGELGVTIRAAIAKSGLVPMDRIWDNGFRQVTSSTKPIRTPGDLAGFKIRVPVTPLLVSLFKGLGESPASITFNEVYSALQTRVVDGQENPLALIETGKLYEVQRYCTLTNHCWSGYWLVANRRALAGLPDELRAILTTNLDQSALEERADLAALDATLQASLTTHGMAFEKPDPAPFHDALREAGFYAQWKKTYGDEAWETLERYAGKLA